MTKQIIVEKYIEGDFDKERDAISGAFEAIKFVCEACTQDPNRRALLNLKCDVVNGVKYLVGTDGMRMHILQTDAPSLTSGKCYAWREFEEGIVLTEIEAKFPGNWASQFQCDCEPILPANGYVFAQNLSDFLFPIARHRPDMLRINHEFLLPLLGHPWNIKVAKSGHPYIFERGSETKVIAVIMPLRG